jgi:hypothetical protein
MWYSMVVRIACNSSGDGFAGSTKRGTKSPAAFTLARALGRYRLVDRVANHDAVAQALSRGSSQALSVR